MLASDDRQISPTRFHNSVHNVAAGYWSIATGAMTTSSVLSAFDASFGAGLLEALTQVVVEQHTHRSDGVRHRLPGAAARAPASPMRSALRWCWRRNAAHSALAQISVSLTDASADRLDDAALESLRTAIPAARGLPLLHAIALRQDEHVVLDYLDSTRLAVAIAPC